MILKKKLVLHHKSNNTLFLVLQKSEAKGSLWVCKVYQDEIKQTSSNYRGIHRLTPQEIDENWIEELVLRPTG